MIKLFRKFLELVRGDRIEKGVAFVLFGGCLLILWGIVSFLYVAGDSWFVPEMESFAIISEKQTTAPSLHVFSSPENPEVESFTALSSHSKHYIKIKNEEFEGTFPVSSIIYQSIENGDSVRVLYSVRRFSKKIDIHKIIFDTVK